MGINIMIAGLSVQVASLFIFMALCTEFAYRVSKSPYDWDPAYVAIRKSLLFKSFLVGQ